jgi:hypothetical protein
VGELQVQHFKAQRELTQPASGIGQGEHRGRLSSIDN